MTTLTGRFGPYRLGALLGRGGMGEVYRAQDSTQGGRTVALKVLAPHLSADPDYRARFRREAETAARLDEPHIVPIHRYGEIDGRLFLDMQLVDGPDLAAELLRGGPMAPGRAVAVIGQVAAALDAAHAAGLVHRDVKPANVLLRSPGPGRPEIAALTDFGIALDHVTGSGGSGDGHGTAEYLAPERIQGAPTDHRVDVYALACVLFELFTGLRAFPGGEFAAQAHGHLHLPPPRPSEIAPAVPPAMDAVVARGMAKDPARRHRSAGDLARDAHAALGDTALGDTALGDTALRDTAAAVPATHGTSRRRLLIGSAAVGGLALAGGATALLWLRGRAAPVVTERVLSIGSTTPLDKFGILPRTAGPLIQVLDPDDTLRFWDVGTDREIGISFDNAAVGGVTLTVVDERPVVATGVLGESFGIVVGADLETGDPAGARIPDPSGAVRAITALTVDDRPVVVTLGDDGVLRRWYFDDGSELGDPVPPLAEAALTVEFARLGSRDVVVRPGADYRFADVLDLATAESLGTVVSGAGSLVEIDGEPAWLLLSEGTLQVHDLSGSDLPVRTLPVGGRNLTTAVVDGRPLAVVDDLENVLTLRDVTTGAVVGSPMAGHAAAISRLGVTEVDGRPVLVSAALDNTIRVWDLPFRAAGG